MNINLSKLGENAASFSRWWYSELTALLPAALHQRIERKKRRIVVKIEGENIIVRGSSSGQSAILAQGTIQTDGSTLPERFPSLAEDYDATATETLVYLPQQKVLQTAMKLPVEALENLREVLGYEIDRQTPFQAEQVYYDYDLAPRRTGQTQIDVKLLVVPRKTLDPLLELLDTWGLQPKLVSTVNYCEQSAERHRIPNLLPPERAKKQSVKWLSLNRLLAISAVILSLLAITIPLNQQRKLIDTLEAEVAVRQTEAEASRALLKDLNRLIPESQFAWKKKIESVQLIELFNELSLLIPDDTWLQRLEVNGSKMKLQGTSASASSLIGILEGSLLLQNATFATAVARDPKSGKERFQIVAKIIPGEET